MSDLNLENIVGFKAVDKDGNEQNVTVDEMVDMVSTRMVMALSETSTFAAAAATGNDVYENELPTVTDAANVRVLQSSGDAAKMTMQSLASKLGELMNSLNLFPFMYKGDTSTFDNWSSGFYSTANNITDEGEKPSGADANGTLLVFNSGYHGLQIYKTFNLVDFYIRTKGGSFRSPWYKFTGVQI
jgi:hypothetical protein